MADALLIVDVQNDFTPPDGALAVPDGCAVIAPINRLTASGQFELVVATRDWHPPAHGSFQSQGGIWPEHCVRDTRGAQLHPGLDQESIDIVIDKGTSSTAPGYSAFEATRLGKILSEKGVERVTITGLATDVCVKHTALDALEQGLRVTIPTAAVRGMDADGVRSALSELEQAGAEIAGN